MIESIKNRMHGMFLVLVLIIIFVGAAELLKFLWQIGDTIFK